MPKKMDKTFLKKYLLSHYKNQQYCQNIKGPAIEVYISVPTSFTKCARLKEEDH